MADLNVNGSIETTGLLHDTFSCDDSQNIPSSSIDYGAASQSTLKKGGGSGEEREEPTDVDGVHLERQSENDGELKRHMGMPEVRKKLKYYLPGLAIGVFLSAADQTIIVSSYGKIGTDMYSMNKISWIATSYFLTLTSFQPLYGKLSDIFSRKSCLLFAYSVFGLGCLFCGLAQSMEQLIAARAFAGIGGGGMTTVVSILFSDIIPLRERGKWQGYLNIIYATGSSVGAPLGGILADYVGWRWSFIMQFPLCVLAFCTVALTLNVEEKDNFYWVDKLKRIDFLGAGFLFSGVFALLLGLDRGGNVQWNDLITISCLSLSLIFFSIFVYVEGKVVAEPFAPGHVIFVRPFLASHMCNFFSFAGWISTLFYVSLYFQAVIGRTATQAGLLLIPSIFSGVLGSLFAGFYMQRTGRYYWASVVSYTNMTLALSAIFLCSGVIANTSLGIVIGMSICAFSNGTGFTTAFIALISNSSHSDQAVATACSYLFRGLGSAIGMSVSSTMANQVLRQYLKAGLGGSSDVEKITRNVRKSLSYIDTLEPKIKNVVRKCYGKSVQSAFGLQICIVAGAIVGACLLREKKLSG